MNLSFRHRIALRAKVFLYAKLGEPYRIGGHTLRYVPGSRPVRIRYKSSDNSNVRFDALQIEVLANSLREGDTVIDVGAHCGQYSIIMAAFCGWSGKVISFEPDPYARTLFENNLNLNPEIRRPIIEKTALSDREAQSILFSKKGNSQSSLVRSAVEFDHENSSEEIRVQTVSLDAYLARNHVPTPAWVKIDAEGAEIRIIRGAEKLLNGTTQVLCELHPYAWPAFGDTLEDLKSLVSASGRRMVILGTNQEVGKFAEYGTVLLERVS